MTLAEFRALAERAIRVEREGAAEKRDGWALTDFHRAASPTAVIALIDRLERAEAFIAKPAKHRFWRPGEAICSLLERAQRDEKQMPLPLTGSVQRGAQ